MGKKKETEVNGTILTTLQKLGWFRNISDKYQVGIPDNVGSYGGLTFGVELKVVDEIPEDGLAPAKNEHRFSQTQVKELRSLQNVGGGIGLGIIVCGNTLFWFTPESITEDGQVDCNRLYKEQKFILKDKEYGWSGLLVVMDILWTDRMSAYIPHIVQKQAMYFSDKKADKKVEVKEEVVKNLNKNP